MPLTSINIPVSPYMQGVNQGQYHSGLLSNYPGGGVIRSHLAGELPADLLANIYQMGSERGIATGMPGSPNANAATMRALGLTSYGIQRQGLEELGDVWRSSPTLGLDPGTNMNVQIGPRDTAYPMGGGSVASAAAGGGRSGFPSPVETNPQALTDAWIEDWMRRIGSGGDSSEPDYYTGSLGVFSPVGGSQPGWMNVSQGSMFMGPRFEGGMPSGTTMTEDASYYDPYGSKLYYGI